MSEFVENNELNEEVESAEEVEATMTSMEDALESVLDIKVGDTVKGDVLAFDDNQVRVAIKESGGLEVVIPPNELSAAPYEALTDVVNIGDEIELVVLKPIKDKENGNFLLSKKRVDAKKVWVEIQEKADKGETITAPVKDVVKGGLVVDAGVRGFVPASMVEDHFVEDFAPYKGQTLEFAIVEIEPSENRLILSHKEIARKEREAKRESLMDELVEDSIVEGTVARLTNFGAFVDLGGVDGLVHISRIAHEHIAKPSDVLTIGDKVNVKVLSVDKEKGRVSLSIKDTLDGPWDNIEEKAERLVASEVGSNNELVNLNLMSYYAPRKKAAEQFNEKYGLTGDQAVEVKLRSDVQNLIKRVESVVVGDYFGDQQVRDVIANDITGEDNGEV